MSGTTTARPAVPGMEHKATSASPDVGLLGTDDETGIVEAIVSVTGVRDHDDDVIEPGAYAKTLKKRTPKGIFHHDWHRWASKTLVIEEWLPGDPRLPKTAKNGEPWPVQAGGLYVKTQYNLATQQGREAYENVKFFGGECEWSVGYRVPPGGSVRGKDGSRRIKEMDLFEYSPVLFGANSMSGTLSVKSVNADAGEDDGGSVSVLGGTAWDALYEEGAAEVAEWQQLTLDEVLEEGDADGTWEDDAGDDTAQEQEEEEGDESGEAYETNPEDDPVDTDADATADDAGDEGCPDGCTDCAACRGEQEGKAFGEHDIDLTMPPPGDPYEAVFRAYRDLKVPDVEDAAMRGRIEQILTVMGQGLRTGKLAETAVALDIMLGELRGNTNPVIASFTSGAAAVLRRAKEAESVRFVKKGKDAGGKAMAHESLNRSPKKNWVENTGELPAYIQHIANDIHEENGVPLGRAIPMAIAAVKRWCRGGGDVNADTRAKACKAVAEWEELKGKNRARQAGHAVASAAKAAVTADMVESDRYPWLPGTYEELRDQIRECATKVLADVEPTHVEVIGTWPTHAVVTAYTAGGDTLAYELPYEVVADSGGPATVTVYDPQQVELTVAVDGDDGAEVGEKLLPYPSMLEDIVAGLRPMLTPEETKAGRVLSGVNASRLRGVVEQLVTLLRSAGIELDVAGQGAAKGGGKKNPDEESEAERELVPAATPVDSPAPAMMAAEGKAILDPSLLARAYRIMAEANLSRMA